MIISHEIASTDKDNNLIVDMRSVIETQFLITNWHKGIRFYLNIDGRWVEEAIDPGLVLISDEHFKQKQSAVSFFLKTIPKELYPRLTRYQYNQFTLLSYLSHYNELRDIFNHSPNMIWLAVTYSRIYNKNRVHVAKQLQQKREKVIAILLGYESKAVVRFINKIEIKEGNQQEYKLVLNSIIHPTQINTFKHWQTIPVQALGVIKKYPQVIGLKLLANYINEKDSLVKQLRLFSEINQIITDIKQMANVMTMTFANNYFNQFKTISDLKSAHDRLVEKFNSQNTVLEKDNVFFPISPLKDTEKIKQIISNYELAKEGQVMHHCVGGYVLKAQLGHSFFYQVLEPQRATLQLSVVNNQVNVQQFKLACNQEPSEESFIALRDWIKKQVTPSND